MPSNFDELRGKIPRSGKETFGKTKELPSDFVYTKVHLASLTAKQIFSPQSTMKEQNIPYILQGKLLFVMDEIRDTQFNEITDSSFAKYLLLVFAKLQILIYKEYI